MSTYTLTVLVKEKVDEKARTGLIDDVKKNFTTLVKEDLWGVRGLAYPIKHNDKAYFAHFEFETEPEKVISLDRNLRLNEDVLRYLVVKSKKIKIRKGKAKQPSEETKKEAKTEKVEVEVEVKEKKTEKKEIKAKK